MNPRCPQNKVHGPRGPSLCAAFFPPTASLCTPSTAPAFLLRGHTRPPTELWGCGVLLPDPGSPSSWGVLIHLVLGVQPGSSAYFSEGRGPGAVFCFQKHLPASFCQPSFPDDPKRQVSSSPHPTTVPGSLKAGTMSSSPPSF